MSRPYNLLDPADLLPQLLLNFFCKVSAQYTWRVVVQVTDRLPQRQARRVVVSKAR